MEVYGLTREDYDTLEEMQFKEFREYPNPFEKIATNVKSAFTRAYNARKELVTQLKAKNKGKVASKGKGKMLVEEDTPKKEEQDEENGYDDDDDDDQVILF